MFKNVLILLPLCSLLALGSCEKKGRTTHATDTLSYEMKSLVTTFDNCLTDSPECTHISYSYPHFTSQSGATESLNAYVKHLLGETPAITLQQTQTTFINDYNLHLKDNDMGQPWYRQTNIDVVYQHDKIVSLKIDMDDYTGGAHGMISTLYYVFDKTQNKALSLQKLIRQDKLAELVILAEKAFRTGSELPEDADLEKAGFWFKDNRFALNENYCITPEGITWLYNPYEIAPYAYGTTEVSLTSEELAPYINPAYSDVWN